MPNTYEPIASNTLSSATDTLTFSSISSNYTDLILTTNCRMAAGTNAYYVRFNSDTGGNYSFATSFGSVSGNQMMVGVGETTVQSSVVHINNYSNATTYKPVFSQVANSGGYARLIVGSWLNINAINSVTVLVLGGATFSIGSSFTLYGIKGA
jgi:hypothetical protein